MRFTPLLPLCGMYEAEWRRGAMRGVDVAFPSPVFARYMIDTFDLMYEERAEAPKLMSIGLHDRLIGRPGKVVGLIRFLEHARGSDRVWFCTGRHVAEHWHRLHSPKEGSAS